METRQHWHHEAALLVSVGCADALSSPVLTVNEDGKTTIEPDPGTTSSFCHPLCLGVWLAGEALGRVIAFHIYAMANMHIYYFYDCVEI